MRLASAKASAQGYTPGGLSSSSLALVNNSALLGAERLLAQRFPSEASQTTQSLLSTSSSSLVTTSSTPPLEQPREVVQLQALDVDTAEIVLCV